MLSKSTIILAALAVAQVTLAQPYCLLTAVNKFEHPADQKTLCCKESAKLKGYLKDLCPASSEAAAVDAYETACKQAGYDTEKCAGSSDEGSSSAVSKTKSKSYATSAPYPVIHTSMYFDEECSCTKTTTYSSSAVAGSTGFATGTASAAKPTTSVASPGKPGSPASPVNSAPAATGSPIEPATTPTKTGPNGSKFTGAASRNVGSLAAGLLAVAGAAIAL